MQQHMPNMLLYIYELIKRENIYIILYPLELETAITANFLTF